MRLLSFVLILSLCLTACNRRSQTSANERHYQLSGKVIALNPKDQTATIDQAAIPNWMEAMTMEYPIKSRAEFDALHVGEAIKATVNVPDETTYYLTNIKEHSAGR